MTPTEGSHYWVREPVHHTLQVVAYVNGEFWAIGVLNPVLIDPRWLVARVTEPCS